MKRNRVSVLGVSFDNLTFSAALHRALGFLGETGEKPRFIVTPNPEIVMAARRDGKLRGVIREADLVAPDGIGVVLASRLNGREARIKERVAGYDLICALFGYMKDAGKTAYFLGAKPGVAKKAAEEAEKKYKGLKVLGCADGYFSGNEERIIIDEIKALKPDLLLVCLGCPKQEYWIGEHLNELPVKLAIGAGGTLDALAGKVSRAPDIFIRLNLEWLYRILSDPKRIRRAYVLPQFAALAVLGRRKG